MSEFECRYGHLMRARDKECEECAAEGRFGEGTYYMDGLTGRQHIERERWEDAQAHREED